MITTIHKTAIKTTDDVCDFFEFLLKEDKCSFHPDDSFLDMVEYTTGQQHYSRYAAQNRDKIMERCFAVCEAQGSDIYELAMNVTAVHFNSCQPA